MAAVLVGKAGASALIAQRARGLHTLGAGDVAGCDDGDFGCGDDLREQGECALLSAKLFATIASKNGKHVFMRSMLIFE
jgi:hypothetical protein